MAYGRRWKSLPRKKAPFAEAPSEPPHGAPDGTLALDIYVEVGRRFALDHTTVSALRRDRRLNGIDRAQAINTLADFLQELGTTEELDAFLCNLPIPLKELTPQIIERCSPRIGQLVLLTKSSRQAARRIIARTPKILLMDTETFMTLIDALGKLIPDCADCERFIAVHPEYFDLDPATVAASLNGPAPSSYHPEDIWRHIDMPVPVPIRGTATGETGTADNARVAAEAEAMRWMANFLRTLDIRAAHARRILSRVRRQYKTYTRAREILTAVSETPGWNHALLRTALFTSSSFFAVPTKTVLERQQWLVTQYGFEPTAAAQMCCTSKTILAHPCDELEEKIRIGSGFTESPGVQREFIERHYGMLNRSINWLRDWRCAQDGHLQDSANAESDQPMPHPEIPADADPVLAAFLRANWTIDDANAHLYAFPSIESIHPDILLRSLHLLQGYFGWHSAAFTKLLSERLREFVRGFERTPFAELRASRTKPARLARAVIDARVQAQAVSIHRIAEASADGEEDDLPELLRYFQQRGVDARSVIKRKPELLIEHGAPLAIAQQISAKFNLTPDVLQSNIATGCRVLFEDPRTIVRMITERHALLAEHIREQTVGDLSPTFCWEWCYFPTDILADRLIRLTERRLGRSAVSHEDDMDDDEGSDDVKETNGGGNAGKSPVALALYAPTDAEFRRRLLRFPLKYTPLEFNAQTRRWHAQKREQKP